MVTFINTHHANSRELYRDTRFSKICESREKMECDIVYSNNTMSCS